MTLIDQIALQALVQSFIAGGANAVLFGCNSLDVAQALEIAAVQIRENGGDPEWCRQLATNLNELRATN